MISITSKSPYAVLALAELARSGGSEPVPIGELARRRDVPVQFLEQLFAVLRRAGIISSQRGVKGGYRFARQPASVTVLEVVELLDGPLGRDAQGVFADAAEATREVLAHITIAVLDDAGTSSAPQVWNVSFNNGHHSSAGNHGWYYGKHGNLWDVPGIDFFS